MLPHCFICIHENNIKQMPIYCSKSFDRFCTTKGYHSTKTSPVTRIFFIIELQSAYQDSSFCKVKKNSPE